MFDWKPKSGVFYRSWSGDGKHNVIVSVIIDGLRYPCAFKVHQGSNPNTYVCDISIPPHEFSQIGRKGRIPQDLLNWSFHFSVPLESARFKKKQQTKTLMPEQGYRTVPVDFKTINYDVEIKNFSEQERSRFNSWKSNFAKGKPIG